MNDAMGFTREDMAQEEREFFREHDAKVRADVIDEFLIKAKKIIRHEVKNAYNHGNVEFNKFAILEKGKTILSEEPFEISANYIIDLLETIKKQLKEQTNE